MSTLVSSSQEYTQGIVPSLVRVPKHQPCILMAMSKARYPISSKCYISKWLALCKTCGCVQHCSATYRYKFRWSNNYLIVTCVSDTAYPVTTHACSAYSVSKAHRHCSLQNQSSSLLKPCAVHKEPQRSSDMQSPYHWNCFSPVLEHSENCFVWKALEPSFILATLLNTCKRTDHYCWWSVQCTVDIVELFTVSTQAFLLHGIYFFPFPVILFQAESQAQFAYHI